MSLMVEHAELANVEMAENFQKEGHGWSSGDI